LQISGEVFVAAIISSPTPVVLYDGGFFCKYIWLVSSYSLPLFLTIKTSHIMRVNLATQIKSRLIEFLEDQIERGRMDIGEFMYVEDLLMDDDGYSDWLNKYWWIIKEYNMLYVRDFMTWSYLLDTESSSSIKLEYYFAESE
jgi:hypothetical protein